MFGTDREKSAEKARAPYYLAEPFSLALKPGSESEAFFCHISWRQAHGSHTRAKRGKKATPRYVAEPFAPLCYVDSGFGGIHAILSGGNPPRYKTNHTFLCDLHLEQLQLDELHAVLRECKAGAISDAEAIKRLERSPYWVWTVMDPQTRL